MIQLDFLQNKTTEELLQDDINSVRSSSDKVRKALFARHNELAKKYLELHERLDIIERNICKG